MRGQKKLRSHLIPRRRGGQIGETLRPNIFAELTTPSAPTKEASQHLLMSRPPLLCEEGNVARFNSFTLSMTARNVGTETSRAVTDPPYS